MSKKVSKKRTLTVDGEAYEQVADLGFSPGAGKYARVVMDDGKRRSAVSSSPRGPWTFFAKRSK